MEAQPIVIERTYDAPSSKVWKALTDNSLMKEWYFDLADFKAKPGFEFEFEGGPDGRTYKHLCRVVEVIEGKKIAYTWRYEGYEGDTLVSFELFDEGEQTRLKLTHTGLETFPSSNPDFAAANFVQGWTEIIGTSLKNYVEKK